MAFQKKYSIRAVFILMTLAVLALGYGQWRRQSILREVGRLQAEGVEFALKRNWWTSAWLPAPQFAQLDANEVAGGAFQIGDATHDLSKSDQQLHEIRHQLRQLGVGTLIVHFKKLSGAQHTFSFDLSLGEGSNSQYRLSDVDKPTLVPGQ